MMKKFLMAAALILGMGTFAASAQEETAAGDNNKMYQPREFTEIAFEGILLDMDQQQKINDLNAKMKEQTTCPKAQDGCCDKKADKKADSDKKAKGRKPGRGDMAPGSCPMANGEVCKEYVMQVKEILTPEQYTTFLENIVFMPKPQPKGLGAPRGIKPRGTMKAHDGADGQHAAPVRAHGKKK